MATLAFGFEEIAPRELRPELYELDGISRATIESHYKLYEGYVNKRNEILQRLDGVDTETANQVYSEIRALKLDLTFAIGGIKNHEIYFEHLGGGGGGPGGLIGGPMGGGFGSFPNRGAHPQTARGARRGWARAGCRSAEGGRFTH